MISFPILASLLGAGETALNKFFLTKYKIGSREYVVSDFLVVIISMTLFLPLFYQHPAILVDSHLLLSFLIVVAIAIAGNIFYVASLNHEKITVLQPFRIFSPFVSLIAATLFFREEVTVLNAMLLTVATGSLLVSQTSKFSLKMHKGIVYAILSMILFSLEPFFLKDILESLNPIMTYYVRALFVFLISYALIRPHLILFEAEKTKFLFTISTASTVKRILLYFGYLHLGVLNTILVVMLRYPLEYVFAWFGLKEKLSWRNVMSSAIILGCVVIYSLNS